MSHMRVETAGAVNQPSFFTTCASELKKLVQRVFACVRSLFEKLFPSWFNKPEETPQEKTPQGELVMVVRPAPRPSSLETGWEQLSPRKESNTVMPGIIFSGTKKLEPGYERADVFVNLYALETWKALLLAHQIPKKDLLNSVLEKGVERYNNKSFGSINEMIACSRVLKMDTFEKESQILQVPRHCESQQELEQWIESVYFAFEKLVENKQFACGLLLRGTLEAPRTFAIWARAKEKPVDQGDKCDIFILDPRGKDESSCIAAHLFKCKKSFCDYFAKVAAPFSSLHSEENLYWSKPLNA